MLKVKSKNATKELITKEDISYKEYSCDKADNGIDYAVKLCTAGCFGYLYCYFTKSMEANKTANIGHIPAKFLPLKAPIFGAVPVLLPNGTPANKMVFINVPKTGEIMLSAADAFSNGEIKARIPFVPENLGGGVLNLFRNLGLYLRKYFALLTV